MKWLPIRSSGRATDRASSPMGIEEVLDTTGVPGATRAETSASTFALASGSSVTASTTAVRVPVRPVETSARDDSDVEQAGSGALR